MRSHQHASFLVTLLLIMLSGCGTDSEPALPQLEPVPYPATTGQDATAERQLKALKQSIERALSDADALPTDAMADRFGHAGQVYQAYRYRDAAAASYRNAIALAPGDWRWLYLVAHLERDGGRFDQALASFERALALLPPDVEHQLQRAAGEVWMGELELGSGRFSEALQAFERALAVNEDSVAAWLGGGKAKLQLGDHAGALIAVQRADALLPGISDIRYQLGRVYRAMGELERARALMETAPAAMAAAFVVHDPLLAATLKLSEGSGALSKRALGAYRTGDFAEAIALYSELIVLEPGDAAYHNNLGGALFKSGQMSQAAAAFGEAMRLRPDLITAFRGLARVRKQQGRSAEERELLQRARAIAPQDADVLVDLGLTLLRGRESGAALALFDQVLAADPAKEGALLGRVKALERLKRPDDARAALAAAAQRLPSSAKIRHVQVVYARYFGVVGGR